VGEVNGWWSRVRALIRDPGVAGLLALGGLFLLVPVGGIGDELFRLRFIWAAQLPFDLAAAWFCARAARVPEVGAVVRRFMGVLSATSLLFLTGDTVQFVRSLLQPTVTEVNGGLVQTVFYLGGCGVLVVQMLLHPTPGGSRGERLRFHLDAVTVLVSGAVLAWCFGVDPTDRNAWATTLLTVCPLLIAAFAAVKMLLSGNAPMTKGGSIPMIAAALPLGVSFVVTPGGEDGLHPGMLVLRTLGPMLFALGPRIQELQTRQNPMFGRRPVRRPYHVLPYLAITLTFVVFLLVMPRDIGVRAWGVVAGVVAITGIVLVRQLLAFLDNFDLINRLDATLLELRGHQALLHEQATHDGLTRLANRTAFGDALRDDLSAGRTGLAVLLIDLDDFKTVNDTLGHGVGDGLITLVAERLRGAVRDDDLVARLGGDEFAVLLRGVTADQAGVMAERILAGLTEPARVDDHMLVVKASIGIAPVHPGDDVEGLMRNADIAMYAAKDAGEGGYRRYSSDMGARILQTAQLAARLREAIGSDQFFLAYQPVVDLDTGAVVGAEALVRWQPPGGRAIPPAEFIPTAESTGDIVPLGRWILGEACRQLAGWRRDHPAATALSMSVNVAGRQLQVPGFVDEVAGVLTAYDLPADRLIIEVTETATLDDPVVLAALHGLRDLGVGLALDDFGTAASSLGLLLTCPMTGLKLDRSFVDRLGLDDRPTAVATAVSQIARALNLGTVAEGVESPEQAERLRLLGYRLAQGYLYAPPLAPDAFAATWHSEALSRR
jgi:diguanylate cyclase (GGDEF)-like protein